MSRLANYYEATAEGGSRDCYKVTTDQSQQTVIIVNQSRHDTFDMYSALCAAQFVQNYAFFAGVTRLRQSDVVQDYSQATAA